MDFIDSFTQSESVLPFYLSENSACLDFYGYYSLDFMVIFVLGATGYSNLHSPYFGEKILAT